MVELDNIAARDPVLTVKAEIIRIDGAAICEWKRFHEISAEVFGFPDFYGNNMNAWIDCMADLRIDSRMSKFLLQPRQMLQIELLNSKLLRMNTADVFDGLLAGAAAVNRRFLAAGESAAIYIVFL